MGSIYVLCHPLTGEVRYVGKTVRKLSRRLSGHLAQARKGNTHLYKWIRSLPGLPIMETVEEHAAPDALATAERFWISQFKAWGFDLTNATDGGEGTVGRQVNKETKAKLRASTAALMTDPERRAQLSKALRGNVNGRGHTVSAAHREKLRFSNLGNTHSLGRIQSAETCLKISRLRGGKQVVDLTTGIVYDHAQAAARSLSLDPISICHVLHGRQKTTKGRSFAYAAGR